MQTEEALRLVVADLFEQLAADNVIYAEMRFAPLLHLDKGLTPEKVVAVVNGEVESQIRATGIEARVLLCTLRHYSREQSMKTAELVRQFRGSTVAGLDIAGDEAAYSLEPHQPAYDYAHEHGLFATAHAGEGAGAESVWETLRLLKPSRIGHGVRSGEDSALIQHLKQHAIHLEVCPSSNVQTNMCADLRRHPVDRLYRDGVSLGINTDCRTIGDTTLDREYCRLEEAFAWAADEFYRCNREALRAAFLPADERRILATRLDRAYASHSAAVKTIP